ncbi:uncharacterized protein METZ01_LOCUS193445, partial [marine metagenome]
VRLVRESDSIKEIDVALTDYGLAILCGVFAFMLIRQHPYDRCLSTWFSVLFISVGLASAIGGTVHGFVNEDTFLHSIFWRGAIACIGVSALSAWMIGTRIVFNSLVQKIIGTMAVVNFMMYFGYVLFFNQDFIVAVANYLPSAIFLLITFVNVYRQTWHRLAFFALVGLALTFVAAGIQQLEIGVHPKYFGHNALYHVVQAVGLSLIFHGSTFFVKFAATRTN